MDAAPPSPSAAAADLDAWMAGVASSSPPSSPSIVAVVCVRPPGQPLADRDDRRRASAALLALADATARCDPLTFVRVLCETPLPGGGGGPRSVSATEYAHMMAHAADPWTGLRTILCGALAAIVDARAVDAWGRGALHYACLDGDAPLADLLLAHGADANARDAEGITPLMAAVGATADVATVDVLLRAGARADATDKDGQSALHLAATGDAHEDAAACALMMGDALARAAATEALDAPDRLGRTPLMLACQRGAASVAVALLRCGAAHAGGPKWAGADAALVHRAAMLYLGGADGARRAHAEWLASL